MLGNEGMIRRFQPLMISGGVITQKKSGTALKLLGADADILSLGDATHEGGDLKIYRNATGDLALSFDADAASNATALSVYGGVVVQNYLTIGQVGLEAAYNLYVNGTFKATDVIVGSILISNTGLRNASTNNPYVVIDSRLVTDSSNHSVKLQINTSDVIVAQATGNGSGGIVDKAVGLYGTTPTTQAAHIADPAESVAANNAAIDAILVALENIGITASA